MPTSLSARRGVVPLLSTALALALLSGCDRRPPSPEVSPNSSSTTPSATTPSTTNGTSGSMGTTGAAGTMPVDPAASTAVLAPASAASQ